MEPTLVTGTRLGHYEIRSKIGAGGVGEVYLAFDTKLDRKVALKILPAEVASNQERMRRFVQEAKAASALNHPNIITIYEIEQIDSVNFIAMELLCFIPFHVRLIRYNIRVALNSWLPRVMVQAKTDLGRCRFLLS